MDNQDNVNTVVKKSPKAGKIVVIVIAACAVITAAIFLIINLSFSPDDKNIFTADDAKRLSLGNISFSIPKEAVDDYNPEYWIVQQFEIDNVGNISIIQISKTEEREYYQEFEENYELHERLSKGSDTIELITSLNGKELEKGYKSITVDGDKTLGCLDAFADDYFYSVMFEADNGTFSEKNFNDFISTVVIV